LKDKTKSYSEKIKCEWKMGKEWTEKIILRKIKKGFDKE